MADFSIAYNILLQNEGGYQKLQADNGNYACGVLVGTNFGISAPTYQDWINRCPTEGDMRNMSEMTAMNIYHEEYWSKIRGNDIINQNTANMLMDMYVNQTGYFNDIVRDAVTAQRMFISVFALPFSDNEIEVINSLDQGKFFDDIKAGRKAAYQLQATKTGQSVFLDGWLARLRRLEWNEKWKNPITFSAVALLILAIGIGVYFYIATQKKLKGLLI